MFDPNVFNDSKQVLNDCFGSEKLFIIKQLIVIRMYLLNFHEKFLEYF